MDSYETTRVVLSRIQALDPENASKIMGLILIQDHGEKEMIRLAFGPESLLHSVVLKARNELGIIPPSSSSSPLLLARQNSASRFISPPPPLAVSSPSWAPPTSPFSLANGSSPDELIHSPDDIKNQTPFYGGGGGGDLVDEFQLPEQLSFLNEQSSSMLGGPKSSDLYYGDLVAGVCRSPSAGSDGLFPYSTGWSGNGNHHRRSCSVADLCLGSEGFGWKPCLYFARGYCKNGTSCRFLHGIPDDDAAVKMESPAAEQQCHELMMRSKSQRASQLMASAFPYSPTGSPVPPSPSKCMSFFMQQYQSSESQRAAAAAALILGEEPHKYMGRARIESLVNPGSRQIYLTFPADSTFREEDVSNYFSIYGPVQDVRIPYQQKRMFGFVTFVYPETVKLILAKGNPHFVCDARVLVKPYKEKGKVPDKYRKERTDFSGCSTPTGLESRDQYDLQQLVSTGAARILYSSSTQEALIRRRIEEQQQAAELQKAIELQGRRFMGLQLLDLKARSFSSYLNPPSVPSPTINPANQEEAPPPEPEEKNVEQHSQQAEKEESGGEVSSPNEDCDFQESSDEHNLPDNPFASPTKSFSTSEDTPLMNIDSSSNHLLSSAFKPCFFPVPRVSSGHGTVGM